MMDRALYVKSLSLRYVAITDILHKVDCISHYVHVQKHVMNRWYKLFLWLVNQFPVNISTCASWDCNFPFNGLFCKYGLCIYKKEPYVYFRGTFF